VRSVVDVSGPRPNVVQWNRESLVVLGGINTEVFFFYILWNAANVLLDSGLLQICGLSSRGLVYHCSLGGSVVGLCWQQQNSTAVNPQDSLESL